MKKQFLCFALSILLLFAFGCAGVTAQSEDSSSSSGSSVIQGTQDEGTESGKTQKAGIKQTAAPETATEESEAGEDVDASSATTPLWFTRESFLEMMQSVGTIYDLTVNKEDLTDDDATDELVEGDETTSVYQLIDKDNVTHCGFFIVENAQGVFRVMLYTKDAATYGDEFMEIAGWVVKICDTSLIDQENAASQVVTDTFNADGSYVNGDYRYMAGTTDDGMPFFVVESAE